MLLFKGILRRFADYLNRNCIKWYSIKNNESAAEINSVDKEGKTALHYAVKANRIETTEILIRFGAVINAQSMDLQTPLHIACILGEEDICLLLLKKGADIDIQDINGNTPSHYAALNGIYI